MKRTSILALFALAVAAMGASYHFTVTGPTWVGTSELTPGAYTVEVQGDKAMIKGGKMSVEVPVKVETESAKYPYTSLHTVNTAGKNTIEELWIGGTKTKLILK